MPGTSEIRASRPDSGMLRGNPSADKKTTCQGPARHADMQLGDLVTYEGRRYVVRGLDPMGLPDRRVDLEDVETGERRRVPIGDLEPA